MIEEFLHEVLPGSQFSLDAKGEDKARFDSLFFHDSTTKPPFDQYLQWKEEKEKEAEKMKYQELRRREYPPLEDLVVALWEKDMELRPKMSLEVQKKRMEVKKKYPKGQS